MEQLVRLGSLILSIRNRRGVVYEVSPEGARIFWDDMGPAKIIVAHDVVQDMLSMRQWALEVF